MLAAGLVLTALTPRQPAPWYSQSALEAQLSAGHRGPAGSPATQDLQVALPDEANKGWGGLAWILISMIPASIGGGLLQPAINSLITQRTPANEIGGMLGISASMLSAANVVAPLAGGAIFQTLGAPAPFLAGGLLLAVLWLLALRSVK
jgi:MFS family permease